MDYIFDTEVFENNFNVKKSDEIKLGSLRLSHIADKMFRLFPYKATGKNASPIVEELSEIISHFFQLALEIKTENMDFESLCQNIIDNIDISPEDIDYLKKVIDCFFFKDDKFVANNIGLYIYQSGDKNKSVERLAFFLFCILGMDSNDCNEIKKAADNYTYNVLEKMVRDYIPTKNITDNKTEKKYFAVCKEVQQRFKKDFKFMLFAGMTEPEDLSNLLSIYYFFYVSQTCLILDKFCEGDRNDYVKLYYALDWEKVSRNRLCCKAGWEALQPAVNHIFCHAITLELINQHKDEFQMHDYIMLNDYIAGNPQRDELVSLEIKKAEDAYTSCIGDYNGFSEIVYLDSDLKTNSAVQHLFKCVEAQFLNTERKRANQFYIEKFTEFCKSRWLKNRKKSGLVLNLTERDIIFLTKLCIRDQDEMRLNSLFVEYEMRGINLDNTSKSYLQDYFTKLNLIDKKSDSGDAQYVKRIL